MARVADQSLPITSCSLPPRCCLPNRSSSSPTPLPQLPVSIFGKVVDRFLAHEEETGWGLMNAATNVLWHAEKPTQATYAHNEAATSALVKYALSADRLN